MSGTLDTPAAWRRLIEESGGAFAVLEEAVEALRRGIAQLDLRDPDLVWVLHAHLLAVGSPSDVLKVFSLELLERADPQRAAATYVEVVELLARSPVVPDRTYPVERQMIKLLADRKVAAALPALALLAGREVYPLSRTAARAVARIVGDTDSEAITDRLRRSDLPEISRPQALSEGVERALFPSKKSSARSSQERRRRLTQENAAQITPDGSAGALRPESTTVRQRRLRAILLGAGRDPARCFNCDTAGPTRVGHVVPADRGGTDLPGNLVALCAPCRRAIPRARHEWGEDPAPRAGEEQPQRSLF